MSQKINFMLTMLLVLLFAGAGFAEIKTQQPRYGNGTKDAPFKITSVAELYWLAEVVNGGKCSEYGGGNCSAELTTVLTVNSNLLGENNANVNAETGEYTGNAPANVWTPIGTKDNQYTGTFDGNGKIVRSLYFNDGTKDYVGLFGYISSRATVQNVGVVDSYFKGKQYVGGVVGYNYGGTISNAYNTGFVSGTQKVGGVVGDNSGPISNAYNTGSVSGEYNVGGVVGGNNGVTISNAYNTGSVSGNDYVGGVVGDNSGPISNAYNTGSVSGNGYVGGVVGHNDGTIGNVYNAGSVSGTYDVGGVAGYSVNGTVSNAYNTGSVSGTGDYVGGVVGHNDGTIGNVYNAGSVSGTRDCVGGVVGYNYNGSISNVYNTGSVSGTRDCVGGVVGYNYDGTISNVYNTGSVSGTGDYVGGVVGKKDNGDINKAYYDEQTCNNCNSYGTGKTLTELASLKIGSKADADFPLLKGETESPWAKNIYYDKATGKLANSNLPYLKSLPKPQDVEMEFKVKDNVIQISSTDDLKNFAKLVNEYHITDVDAELTTNLTVNSNLLGENNANVDAKTGEYKGSAPANVWTPIGTKDNQYTGTFDGKGYTVSGLYFNDERTNYVGLFGRISSGATVQNVGVIDSYLSGGNNVGGVVGEMDDGEIINVYNTGSVSGFGPHVGGVVGYNNGGTVSNSYNTGTVSVTGSAVGGVVGFNQNGTIVNVYNTGSVSGEADDVGGVVGRNYSTRRTISNVYNTGSVSGEQKVGGVVGYNDEGTISNVYNTGSVSGDNYVGGVVGKNRFKESTIINVYNTGSVSGDNYVGGVVGDNGGDINNAYYDEQTCNNCNSYGTGKTLEELANLTIGSKADADFPLLKGETESPWAKIYYDKATEKLAIIKLPYLKSLKILPKPQDVEMEFNAKDNVIQISSTDDLKNFAKLVNEYHITDVDAELTTNLTVNSNLLGENNANVNAKTGEYKGSAPANVWTPIGTNDNRYTGTFDGKGYTVSGLYFNSDSKDYVGLFGYISSGATVQNVGVIDSYLSGRNNVGGVVGINEGTISNAYNTGSVSGFGVHVGGVVGFNYGGTIGNVYNTGSVSGEQKVGGVVGSNENSTISNVYNTGSVSGDNYVGGVVGDNGGDINNAYYDKQTCNNCNSYGTGKTLTELASLKIGSKADADFPLLKGETESPWAKNIYYDKATGKLANSELPYLKSLPKPQDVEMEFKVKDNVIQISSTDDLKNFAKLVNEYHITDVDAELTTNLTVNSNLLGENNANVKSDGSFDVDAYKKANSYAPESWTPIGTKDNQYTGKFNGNGKTVSGLYFNSDSKDYVGLFGYISGATVQNVGVIDSYLRGGHNVGGVVGYNNGGTISNAYNTGFVSGTGDDVGGVVGYNYAGTISNVYNTGSVSGEYNVGGVVGYNDNSGKISNVYNTGSVSGELDVGGVVGGNGGDERDITNAYYNTDVACEKCNNTIGDGKTTFELASAKLADDLGFGKDVWTVDAEKNPEVNNDTLIYKLPGLKNLGGSVEFVVLVPNGNDVYEISSAQQLKWFAQLVNNGKPKAKAILKADITFNDGSVYDGEGKLKSNLESWTPIGTKDNQYTGKFDGKGYTVSGLYFNDKSKDYVGLFGYISSGATVQNVGVIDSYLRGHENVGGVVGFNYGGTISNAYNTGAVSGFAGVGGVVGGNGGKISNVYNTGSVNGEREVGGVVGNNSGSISKAYNTGSVSGEQKVGGVVGDNSDIISNVYNTGSVRGTGDGVGGVVGINNWGSISYVYNTGSVSKTTGSGGKYFGSVVGQNNGGILTNTYYNKETSAFKAVGAEDGTSSDVEGSAGKTTVELAGATLMTLSFDGDVWTAGNATPEVKEGKLVCKLPGLKNLGGPVEFAVFTPNKDGVYEISSAQQLKWFAQLVNNVKPEANAILKADITFNDGSVYDGEGKLKSNLESWTPIGTSLNNAYTGTFDGKGYTVSGLYFNDGTKAYVGFFGYISGATVQNVGVIDSYLRGNYNVGGVVGYNGGTISNAYNTGAVSGANYNVGGVVGFNNCGTISNVYNTGSVSGNGGYVGGVAGLNYYGSISNVYNTGSVSGIGDYVGGVVGYNDGTIGNVYNTGSVNGTGDGVGGVVGLNGGNDGDITNAYYNTDVACEKCNSTVGVGKTTFELASAKLADDLGFGEDVWTVDAEKNPEVNNGKLIYKLPGLKNLNGSVEFAVLAPNGNDVYEISSAQQLKWFAQLVNNGKPEANAILKADITFNDGSVYDGEGKLKSNLESWTPIGTSVKAYTGTFDGKGYTVSGLYFNDKSKDYVGLFGVTTRATVQNVGVIDSYIRGGYYVGGVVGQNSGTISNVYNTGSVSGEDYVGGVVGQHFSGTISNAYNSGMVSGYDYEGGAVGGVIGYNYGGTISNAYNAGSVSGTNDVGGVVGINRRSISNVYNTGSVSGTQEVGGVVGNSVSGGTISNVYNTGSVSGTQEVGSVVGKKDNGNITNAYYNTDVACEKCNSTVGVGKTTFELASAKLTDDLDFGEDVWTAGNATPEVKEGKLVCKLPGLTKLGGPVEFVVLVPNGNDVYEISSAQQLKWFAQLVNNGKPKANAILKADITFNDGSVYDVEGKLKESLESWTPMGTTEKPFTGRFNALEDGGAAHTISGLYFNNASKDTVGLFGRIGEGGQVVNVGIVKSYIKGRKYVGSVAGLNEGSVSTSFNSSDVAGSSAVGGVVGRSAGEIVNVYNAGAVSGASEVGGVVGNNGGSVNDVYSIGAVSGTGSNVGGAVGRKVGGTISGVYYDKDMPCTNCSDVAGVSGKYSVELADYGFVNSTFSNASSVWSAGSFVNNNGKLSFKMPYLTSFGAGTQPTFSGSFAISAKKKPVYKSKRFTADDIYTANFTIGSESFNKDAKGFVFSSLNDLTESGTVGGTYHGVNFSLLMDPLVVVDGDKATVHGESKQTLKIAEGDGFTIKGPITIKRNFTANGYSTVMFPFSMKASSVSGATFYELANVVMKDGKWVVAVSEVKDTETEVGMVKANTPYLVKTANASTLVLDEGEYAFVPTDGTLHSVESNGWNLVGTYGYKKWEEGDAGLGLTYGFAGAKGNPTAQIGKFGKIGAGAYIYPMRVYLEKNEASGVRSANGAKASDAIATLPESVDVVVVDGEAGEKTTVIGTLDTRTGEFKAAGKRYFDAKGRSVGKKPAAKGSYYNKRKAVAR